MIIDENLYVTRVSKGSARNRGKLVKKTYRNWFLIKYTGDVLAVQIGTIVFPKDFIGKRIRLKIEVIEEE